MSNNLQPQTDTDSNGTAFRPLSTLKAGGAGTLTTLIQAHMDYFNCCDCAQIHLLATSGNVPNDTLINVMAAHSVAHWNTISETVGTNGTMG